MNDARNAVRNGKIQESQKTYNTADKKQGSYYILNETPEQANARYLKEHGINPEQAKAADAAKPGAAKPGVAANKDEAKNSESKAGAAAKAGKADSKQAGKALPKTSAVK